MKFAGMKEYMEEIEMFEGCTIDTSLNGFLAYFKFLCEEIIIGTLFILVFLKIADWIGYSAQGIVRFIVGV